MVILVTFYIIKTRIFYCCNRTRTPNHLVRKWTLNHLAKLTSSKWLCCVVSTYLYGCLTVCSCHVTYAFQSESTISSGLNGWVFVYELSGCGFESRCSHLEFVFCTFILKTTSADESEILRFEIENNISILTDVVFYVTCSY